MRPPAHSQRKPLFPHNPFPIRPIRPAAPSTSPIPQPDYLSRWLADTDDATSPAARLWRLFQTPRFADLWYAAREAGEHLRAAALSALSLNRLRPGGAHPDPREPAAFSANAILAQAARCIGLSIWQMPEPLAAIADELDTEKAATVPRRPTHQLAWLMTYPSTPESRPPNLATRGVPSSELHHQRFALACMLGFACKEHARLADPDAPAGIILLPHDPPVVSILHQFAIALLGLPRDCPDEYSCACNAVRERFNAAPPDHEQPTDALSLEDLRDLVKPRPRAAPIPGEKVESGPLA